MKYDFHIREKEDLIRAVNDLGFLPFFQNSIEGFSIEEHVDPKIWFGDIEGPWEWKGPVIRELGCAYGKFFEKKAAYISRKWFPDFANYRRNGYDFDARFDDELASYQDKKLFDLVDANAPLLSKELKKLGNYRKGGNKGFDTIITRLQSQCYVIISDAGILFRQITVSAVCFADAQGTFFKQLIFLSAVGRFPGIRNESARTDHQSGIF